MIKNVDVVIDLQAGDTGKGKVSHGLAEIRQYDAVLRFNGGANAGHTIYVNGTKIVTHQVPVGIFHNIPSIIGPGCVVNMNELNKELLMLKEHGYSAPLYIDKRVHMTTEEHLIEDSTDTVIGTTRKGIGPTYRDKYFRKGKRIGDVINYHEQGSLYEVIDIYDVLYTDKHGQLKNILCEGAQGFQIDIDWGDYPYVTSSHCTIGAVCLNGIAPRYIRHVFGTMKAYETYSGFKTHYTTEEDIELFEKIQNIGKEFGATTGRKRQVRWLHLDDVIRAMHINNITHLIINKKDVLDQLNVYKVMYKNTLHEFTDGEEFKNFVNRSIKKDYIYLLQNIIWSTSPEKI